VESPDVFGNVHGDIWIISIFRVRKLKKDKNVELILDLIDDSKNRLFLPVNDYGEFTDEVPERKGIRVYDANKDVIQKLKEEGKLIGQRSYEHSYPHCRRCDTPLISKALTSWFIKEPSLTPLTVPHAEAIGFVPETVRA